MSYIIASVSRFLTRVSIKRRIDAELSRCLYAKRGSFDLKIHIENVLNISKDSVLIAPDLAISATAETLRLIADSQDYLSDQVINFIVENSDAALQMNPRLTYKALEITKIYAPIKGFQKKRISHLLDSLSLKIIPFIIIQISTN